MMFRALLLLTTAIGMASAATTVATTAAVDCRANHQAAGAHGVWDGTHDGVNPNYIDHCFCDRVDECSADGTEGGVGEAPCGRSGVPTDSVFVDSLSTERAAFDPVKCGTCKCIARPVNSTLFTCPPGLWTRDGKVECSACQVSNDSSAETCGHRGGICKAMQPWQIRHYPGTCFDDIVQCSKPSCAATFYAEGVTGTNSCPSGHTHITDEGLCELAAKAAGVPYEFTLGPNYWGPYDYGLGEWREGDIDENGDPQLQEFPKGCFLSVEGEGLAYYGKRYDDDTTLAYYFNGHETGGQEAQSAPVCSNEALGKWCDDSLANRDQGQCPVLGFEFTVAPPVLLKTMGVSLPMPAGECEKQTAAEVTANVGGAAAATGQAALLDLDQSTGSCEDAGSRARRGPAKDNFQVTLAFKKEVTPQQVAAAVKDTNDVIAAGNFEPSLAVDGQTFVVTVPKTAVVTEATITAAAATAASTTTDTSTVTTTTTTTAAATDPPSALSNFRAPIYGLYKGQNGKSFSDISLEECAKKCVDRKARCRSFQYRAKTKTCGLKKKRRYIKDLVNDQKWHKSFATYNKP